MSESPKKPHVLRPAIALAGLLIAGAVFALITGRIEPTSAPAGTTVEVTGSTMGTTYIVKLVTFNEAADREKFAKATDQIRAVLAEVDNQMSTYKPDSELSRFNQHADLTPFPVSKDLLTVFQESQRISELSGGAFDITVGPLVNAWGFGPEKTSELPTDEQIAALKQRVGYKKIEIDAANSTLRKTQPDVYCDLSAIAQGFACDKVVEALDAMGIQHFMVDVSGEIRTRGGNANGKVWQIAIERPESGIQRTVQLAIPLSNKAIATSGDYRNYFEREGKRYSHEIDPNTGKPITHNLASVSVITDKSMTADGLATALIVLGPEKGYELAASQNLAAFFIIHDASGAFVVRSTPAFDAIEKSATPEQ
ncbi:MAG: FAD:protein FMN transferase [Candidatus Hydrogenedentes bacterium]|nr:FAD:protein FMN transferase [Candidatus Hydrogenedentota bacterium]